MRADDEIEGWNRLSDLFDQAIEKPAAERGAFVARVCADEPALGRSLEELLVSEARAGTFMEAPLVRRAAGSAASAMIPSTDADADPTNAEPVDTDPAGDRQHASRRGEPRIGDHIGAYRVLRPLGQGGMSTVFLAIRDDDTFKRRVVVKLVRADLRDADLERRLRTERHILASLAHPNIARLFDGGTTEDGRPYFVMEYVEGLPITTFADRYQLSVDERSALFRKVLGAVQYAHQNLVVHRDLKPSNILVAADGEPHLLDFGIAKLLNPDLSADDVHATATWLRLMTPHYASPEQVCGKLVGTASDIYSLGVLLYELLAGRLPFDFARATPGEIERTLTERDPPRPSTVVVAARADAETTAPTSAGSASSDPASSDIARNRMLEPHELQRRLRGDLDAIIMKALRSAPQRRYASAERFADDLERFAKNLPVGARKGTWYYRIGKLVRRRRTAAAVTISLALALAVGAGVLAQKHAQVLRERDNAQRERSQRDTVLALLLEVLQVADPNVSLGETYSIREALDSSAPKLRRLLADQPALRAELLHTTGTIYHNLGLWPRARVDLEAALSLRKSLFGDRDPSVARTQSRLALVLANLGEVDTARALTTQAVETSRGARGSVPAADVAILNDQVTVLCAAQDYEAALPLAEEALALARSASNREGLPTALINRAMVALRKDEPTHAAVLFQQGAELLALRFGDDHPRLVNPLSNLGSARRRAGDLTGARDAFEQALTIQQTALGETHPTLAITLNNLAGIHVARGEHAEAIEVFGQAADVFERQAGPDHPRLFFLEIQIAQSRIAAGTPSVAREDLQQSLAHWRNRIGAEHRFVLLADLALGRALTALGDFDAAEPLLHAGFDRAMAAGWQRDAASCLALLRTLHEAMGTPERSEPFARRLEDWDAGEG